MEQQLGGQMTMLGKREKERLNSKCGRSWKEKGMGGGRVQGKAKQGSAARE